MLETTDRFDPGAAQYSLIWLRYEYVRYLAWVRGCLCGLWPSWAWVFVHTAILGLVPYINGHYQPDGLVYRSTTGWCGDRSVALNQVITWRPANSGTWFGCFVPRNDCRAFVLRPNWYQLLVHINIQLNIKSISLPASSSSFCKDVFQHPAVAQQVASQYFGDMTALCQFILY